MKKMILLFAVLIAFVFAFSACANAEVVDQAEAPQVEAEQAEVTQADAGQAEEPNPYYLVLVNKENRIPGDWEENLKLVEFTGLDGGTYHLEEETFNHFNALHDALLEEGIDIGVYGAYVSSDSQVFLTSLMQEHFGLDYVEQYMDAPDYYEHQTGLAIDVGLIKDGVEIFNEDDLRKETEIFEKIYAKLPEYGFILRYPGDKKDVTMHLAEPWHIRYVGSVDVAKEIAEKGITLEEYLGG